MKTETQEQLEKEIKEIKAEILKHVGEEEINYERKNLNHPYDKLFITEAKLSQHKTDIKKFEKLIDRIVKDIGAEQSEKHLQGMEIFEREIKEALKEL